ncbi:cytochrome c oxidase assembly protein [Arthrobacter sp. SX1312]|uniref:cytochrome c oxidase assembly protein n=1 Tax=Arthrobacter sp. SX1312 TaxID=2058896 RepID=UPI000CE40364|nr:cytochrome c oxidase assembly protein [Arthrobacter sp. SX1312]
MPDGPHHPGPPAPVVGDPTAFALDAAAVVVWACLAVLYLAAGRAAALRGRDARPLRYSIAWLSGTALGLAVTAGPLARAAAGTLTGHMAVHLVLGMIVPLLLVLGAPATVFLRAVPGRVGRTYSRIVRTAALRLLAHPLTAMLLATVPMALLYWDGAGLAVLHHAVLGPLLHVHFVASGTLFAYAVIGIDPHPHRAPAWVRAAVVVAAIAVHGMVAKHLYSVAGRGGMPPDTEQAALLMYYGGDVAHALLLVLFCAQVYRETGRHRRGARMPSGSTAGSDAGPGGSRTAG